MCICMCMLLNDVSLYKKKQNINIRFGSVMKKKTEAHIYYTIR